MKTKLFVLFIALGYALTTHTSCTKPKDYIIEPKPDTTYITGAAAPQLKDFFGQARVASQLFTRSTASSIYIIGTKGTKITIPYNSLLHKNGAHVTGNVDIELKEIYSNGDMILSNATTTSGNSLLQSGGEIYMCATQNGEKLRIDHSNPVSLEYPVGTNLYNGTQLFRGTFNQNNNLAADSAIDWKLAAVDTAVIKQDSMGGNWGSSYSFVTDSFGWSNCDRFYNLQGGTDPMIKLPAGYDNSNTAVYMIFDNEHSVATSDIYALQICKFHSGSHTPTGMPVTIVAISLKDKKYYYDIEHEVTSSGAVFNTNMKAATLNDIKVAVGAL